MELLIDTSKNPNIVLSVANQGKEIARIEFEAKHSQAEKLLPGIDDLLKNSGLSLEDISEVSVKSSGDSFTSLRIGIVTANTLAYALGVHVSNEAGKYMTVENIQLVKPEYSQEPHITQPRK
jgi:tRNA threonylcarbamoyladenosine biosynthesis protein TsaB